MKKLSENQLREIIRESVKQILNDKENHLITEMAYPRNIYKGKIDNEMPQIIINWCLVHYCTLIKRNRLKKLWKGELRGHLFNAARFSIKNNDSIEKRLKVLNEIWDENDYSIPNIINLIIHNKFYEEGIDLQTDEYATTIIDCINYYQDIFNAILSRNTNIITQYIETI